MKFLRVVDEMSAVVVLTDTFILLMGGLQHLLREPETPPYPHQAVYMRRHAARMNTVSHPLPPFCKNLDNFKNPATHPPVQKHTPPKNFIKILKKLRQKKTPRVATGG
jgi:hypothetical protein